MDVCIKKTEHHCCIESTPSDMGYVTVDQYYVYVYLVAIKTHFVYLLFWPLCVFG